MRGRLPLRAIEKKTRPCERSCKAGAISMGPDKKAFIDPAKCTSCGACVYQCPFGAIMDKSFIVDAIQMLQGAEKWGFRVYAAVAPSIAGQFAPADLGQVVTGLKMLGFHDVVEVALGADMTAKEEAGELEEKGMLASSCCPAFVDYVEKNFPEQAHLVSQTPSPMVMAGRYIKKRDPSAKVIFIGPCVAKKKEVKLGKTMRAVDSALTFEELYAMFESRGIDVSKLEDADLDQASGFGRSFARSGGVTAAVAEALKERGSDFSLKPLPCSGLEACKLAFLKAVKGVGDFNFIEGMACEGGCVQAPPSSSAPPRTRGMWTGMPSRPRAAPSTAPSLRPSRPGPRRNRPDLPQKIRGPAGRPAGPLLRPGSRKRLRPRGGALAAKPWGAGTFLTVERENRGKGLHFSPPCTMVETPRVQRRAAATKDGT